jgi:UDP-2,3-diacylglucosamine pyrophosphatase LpxH
MRHTVVISDIHFSETEPGSGLWMRYRQKAFSPDGELAAMISALLDHVRGDELTLVLNGDIFDLDAPRVIGGKSEFHDLPRDADHAVPALAGILADCPRFIAALGRVLSEGHTVVLIAGNHDIVLALPEVRALVAARILDAAVRLQGDSGRNMDCRHYAALEARLLFRSWFFLTREGILVEHGHQYDPYCSYRYPMAPYGHVPHEIQPTMGSLGARLLVARLGYINPHTDSSVALSRFEYMAHWVRYYLFSRRSIAAIWLYGTARTIGCLLRRRHVGSLARRLADIRASARETGTSTRAIARHARLFATPAEDTLWLVLRELWIDQVILLVVGAALGAVISYCLLHGWLWGAILGFLLLAAYERLFPKPPLHHSWRRIGLVARKVADIHGARAVVFGHTHHPEGRWEDGFFFGNTGTWSAMFRDLACTEELPGDKPLVWLTTDAKGELAGGLMAWAGGRFEPRCVKRRTQGAKPEHHDDAARVHRDRRRPARHRQGQAHPRSRGACIGEGRRGACHPGSRLQRGGRKARQRDPGAQVHRQGGEARSPTGASVQDAFRQVRQAGSASGRHRVAVGAKRDEGGEVARSVPPACRVGESGSHGSGARLGCGRGGGCARTRGHQAGSDRRGPEDPVAAPRRAFRQGLTGCA